jgi:signal transduction histidine kinase
MTEEIARRAALAIDNLQLYAAAQDAVRARDDFLSIAAHELRPPLPADTGVAQLLLRAQEQGRLDTPRLQRHLDALVSQSSRLAQLTDDLLDVSRLRTGRLELRLQALELGSLVAASLERYGEILDDQHPLRFHHAPTCPVLVDPDRLDQVLGNVVSNAAKYSPAGGPIDLHVRPSDGGALLEVSDRGIGLTPGTEEVIFEPFGRAPNAARRQIPGMGLGLHISREIVLRHGGRMWATSGGEDQGTTIAVWLPCAHSPAA